MEACVPAVIVTSSRSTQHWVELRRRSARSSEEQDIAVGVLERETAQPVVRVLERLDEFDVARSELGRQCVGIRNVNESVPACDALLDIPRVVRDWCDANRLEQDLRAAPPDDAEE